jgi:hypothetical protein
VCGLREATGLKTGVLSTSLETTELPGDSDVSLVLLGRKELYETPANWVAKDKNARGVENKAKCVLLRAEAVRDRVTVCDTVTVGCISGELVPSRY